MRDYYSEEIEQSVPKRDYFTEELIKNKPDRAENILQKAAKAVMTIAQPDVQVNSQFPFLPKIGGISQNVYDAGMDITSDKLTDTGHPVAASAVPIASSLLSGVALGAKPLARGAGKLGKSLFKPSETYGEALNKSTGKVNFLDIISKYSDDPAVAKVLKKSKIVEKYGGQSLEEGGAVSEKLANLSAKESQNLINDVKLGKEVLLSGKRIRSNEVGLAKFFSELSKAQTESTGLGTAKKLYGVSKNVGKFVKRNVGNFVTGSVIGAGAKTAYDVLK